MQHKTLSDEELSALRSSTRGTKQDTRQPITNDSDRCEIELPHASLTELHFALADAWTGSLSKLLDREVVVRLRDQSLSSYSQFVLGQPIPTVCAVVRAESLGFEAYFAMQPSVLFPMIDSLLGCKQSDPIPSRPITEIESGLAEVLFSQILGDYQESWQSALSLNLAIARIEHNVQRLGAMNGGQKTYRSRYEILFGSEFGHLEICLPWDRTTQLRQRLSASKSH